MKYLNRISAALLVLPAVMFTACEEEADYTAATSEGGAQVYFSADNATQVELTRDDATFTVALARVNDAEAITVPITATTTHAEAFTLPSAVSFAAGEKTAIVEVGFDESVMDYNVYDSITLAVDPAYATLYGLDSFTFTAGIALTWSSIGVGQFTEDWYWGIGPVSIEIQQQDQNPKAFRMPNPFKAAYPGSFAAGDTWFQFELMDEGTVIDSEAGVALDDEGYVYYEDFNTGYLNSNYDAYINILHPASGFAAGRTLDGWANNRVTDWQDNGLPGTISIAPYYYMFGVGGWNATGDANACQIVFPGYELKDYSVEVEDYLGAFISPDGDVYAQVSINFTEDVDSVVIVPAAGKTDLQAALMRVLYGEAEDFAVATSAGTVNVPMPYAGEVGVVAVSFGDGDAQDYDYVTFDFPNLGGDAEEEEVPEDAKPELRHLKRANLVGTPQVYDIRR